MAKLLGLLLLLPALSLAYWEFMKVDGPHDAGTSGSGQKNWVDPHQTYNDDDDNCYFLGLYKGQSNLLKVHKFQLGLRDDVVVNAINVRLFYKYRDHDRADFGISELSLSNFQSDKILNYPYGQFAGDLSHDTWNLNVDGASGGPGSTWGIREKLREERPSVYNENSWGVLLKMRNDDDDYDDRADFYLDYVEVHPQFEVHAMANGGNPLVRCDGIGECTLKVYGRYFYEDSVGSGFNFDGAQPRCKFEEAAEDGGDVITAAAYHNSGEIRCPYPAYHPGIAPKVKVRFSLNNEDIWSDTFLYVDPRPSDLVHSGDFYALSKTVVARGPFAVIITAYSIKTAAVTYGFDDDADCSSRELSTTGLPGTPTPWDFSSVSAGLYNVCVDTGSGWIRMHRVSLQVVDPQPSSIADVFPRTVGTDITVPFTVAIDDPPPLAGVKVGLAASTACSSMRSGYLVNGNGFELSLPNGAQGTYYVCLSYNDGGSWVYQSSAGVVTVHASTVRPVITPAVVGAGVATIVTITGAVFTETVSRIQFRRGATSCGSDDAVYDGGAEVAFPALTAGMADLCYSVNNGGTWTAHTGVVEVYGPTATSLSVVEPTDLWESARPTLTFTGLRKDVPTAKLHITDAPAPTPADCNTGIELDLTVSGAETAAIRANVPAGTYRACYSATDGISWAVQSGFTLDVTADPSSVDITDVSPRKVGAGNTVLLTFTTGRAPSPTAKLGLAPNGQCGMPLFELPFDATSKSVTFTLPPTINQPDLDVYVCLSADNGATFVQQTASPITISLASPVAVSGISPSIVLENTDHDITFTGVEPLTTSWVALAPTGECNTGNRFADVAFSGSTLVRLGARITVSGPVYAICYSTDNGGTFTEQTLVDIRASSDLTATYLDYVRVSGTTAAPTAIALGTAPPQMQIFLNTAATSPSVSFSLGACDSTRVGQMSIGGSTGVHLATPANDFVTAGLYDVCFSANAGPWGKQISAGVQLRVVDATTTSIQSANPPTIGLGSGTPVTLKGMYGTPTTRIAFTKTTCASVEGEVSIAEDSVVTPVLSSSGTWQICYDTGRGYRLQSVATLNVIAATSNTFNGVSPSSIGQDYDVLLDVTKRVPSAVVAISSAWLALSSDMCGTVFEKELNYAQESQWAVTFSGSGVFHLCYSVDNKLSWQIQSGLTVTVIAPPTNVAVTPDTFGAGTVPVLTFTNLPSLPSVLVAFTLSAGCASGRVSTTAVPSATTATLGAAFPVVGIEEQAYRVCVSVNGGDNWSEQAVTRVTSISALATTITAISPDAVARNRAEDVTVSPRAGFTGAQVAFVRQGSSCASAVARTARSSLPIAASTYRMESSIPSPADYEACFSADGGVTWVKQTNPNTILSVVDALGSSITAASTQFVEAGVSTSVSFTGAIATPSTRLAVVPIGSPCSSGRLSEAAVTSGNSLDIDVPAGDYEVCYSVDGTNFVKQTLVIIYALEALPTSITSLGINAAAEGLPYNLDVRGLRPSPNTFLAFTIDGDCSAGRVSVTAFPSGNVSAMAAIGTAGEYTVCYSINGVDYVAQTGVTLPVVVAGPTDVVGVFPQVIGSGSTSSTFELTFPSRRRRGARSLLSIITPEAQIGLALETAVGLCETPSNVEVVTDVDDVFVEMLGSPASFGVYKLCWSVDGANWVTQTDPSTEITVIGASATSIIGLLPYAAETGNERTVSVVGGFPISSAGLAFVPVGGGCASLGDLSPVTGGQVTVPALAEGVYDLCYTVNNGATWELQTAPTANLTVVSCLALAGASCMDCQAISSLCSYCMPSLSCTVDAALCTNVSSSDVILAGDSCPTWTSEMASMRGSTAGRTEITLSGSNFPEPAFGNSYQCVWLATSNVLTPAQWVSSTELRCSSIRVSEDIGSATVTVRYGGADYSDAVGVFTYYSCNDGSPRTCSACAQTSRPECGTCFDTAQCGAAHQCAGLYGFGDCPYLAALNPNEGSVDGGFPIVLTGDLFIGEGLACQFRENDRVVEVPVVEYVSQAEVVCIAPSWGAAGNPEVSLVMGNRTYSETSDLGAGALSFEFVLPEAVVVVADDGPAITGGQVALVVILLLLVCCVAGAIAAYYLHQRNIRINKLPPKLTPQMRDEIVYTRMPKYNPSIVPHLKSLHELLVNPTMYVPFAISKVTESTETDRISKALAIVAESKGSAVTMINRFVSFEVAQASSQQTMFRTNSFATKLFKTFSKMAGLEYLHSTLAFPLYDQLRKYPNLDIKGESVSNIRDTFKLLEVCQHLFLAIVKSKGKVPGAFRDIFSHVAAEMHAKWPVNPEDLSKVIAAKLTAQLEQTEESFQHSAESFDPLHVVEHNMASSKQSLSELVRPLQDNLGNFKDSVNSLDSDLKRMMKLFDELEGALVPGSKKAELLLEQHKRATNSIAVGGFFFLRFLVPAITAPEAYHLVRENPDTNQRRTLVLVGKVLQNLSNNKRFGAKEEAMEKLNEFISVNQTEVCNLFAMLADPTAVPHYDPIPVPENHANAALCEIFNHISINIEKIVEVLDTPSAGMSDTEMVQRKQTARMLVKFMETATQMIGENTDTYETLLQSMGGQASTATVATSRIENAEDERATFI